LDRKSEATAIVPYEEEVLVEVAFSLRETIRNLVVALTVLNDRGEVVLVSWDTDSTDLAGAVREAGTHVSTCTIPPNLLKPGRYLLSVVAHVPNVQILERRIRAVAFDVSPVGYPFKLSRDGSITPVLHWTVRAGTSVPDPLPG
jgi:hypothetical protein